MFVLGLGLSTAALAGLTSCGEDPLFPFGDDACQAAIEGPDAVDAFDWLKDPYGGQKRLRDDWSTDDSLAFASELQRRGAVSVTAVGVRRKPGPEPSQEALGLVARLPTDPPSRLRLFELHAAQVRSAGYRPRPDKGQKYLFYCWNTRATTK